MIDLFVCGDIATFDTSDNFIDERLSSIIASSDCSIFNLEGIENNNDGSLNHPFQSNGTIRYLAKCGFNVALLANNHISDGSKKLFLSTLKKLRDNNIYHLGAGIDNADANNDFIIDLKGVRFGFINVCEAQKGHFDGETELEVGYSWFGCSGFDDRIADLKRKVDKVIVFAHTGLEDSILPIEHTRDLFRNFCDLGADCVVGGHPHVPQGIELYNNKYICYSVGNFFFPESAENRKHRNYSFSLKLRFKYDSVEIFPIYHCIIDNKVILMDEKDMHFSISSLSNILIPSVYNTVIDNVYKETFRQRCFPLLKESLMGLETTDSFTLSLKNVVKYLFFRKKYYGQTFHYRQKLLLRLFENEVYCSIIKKYLKNL